MGYSDSPWGTDHSLIDQGLMADFVEKLKATLRPITGRKRWVHRQARVGPCSFGFFRKDGTPATRADRGLAGEGR